MSQTKPNSSVANEWIEIHLLLLSRLTYDIGGWSKICIFAKSVCLQPKNYISPSISKIGAHKIKIKKIR